MACPVQGPGTAKSGSWRKKWNALAPVAGQDLHAPDGILLGERQAGVSFQNMKMSKFETTMKSLGLGKILRLVWANAPHWARNSGPMRCAGHVIYDKYSRNSGRVQTHTTFFFRNLPMYETLSDLNSLHPDEEPLKITSLGCSSGAELYSLLHILRVARPDRAIVSQGFDLSPEIVEIARTGVYDPQKTLQDDGIVPRGTVKDLAAHLQSLDALLDRRDDGMLQVRDWLRDGTSWAVGDASSPDLADQLVPQDIVLANNFLGPMQDAAAEACIRNILPMVKPGGYLVLDGVDRDLKTRLLPTLGLDPVTDRIRDILAADPTKQDWPWTRWSNEPINPKAPNRDYRYAVIFQRSLQ